MCALALNLIRTRACELSLRDSARRSTATFSSGSGVSDASASSRASGSQVMSAPSGSSFRSTVFDECDAIACGEEVRDHT